MSPDREARDTVRRTGTVVGLFRKTIGAERAIRDLKDAGFTDTEIGVLLRDPDEARRLTGETGTLAGEGAAAGAVTGGVLGGLIGLLAGVGALAIPGVGPLIAGGALASTLAGVGAGAAVGGLVGALIGLGIPEEEARYYDRALQEGGILVSVDAGSRVIEARSILVNAGAEFAPSSASLSAREEALIEQSGASRGRQPWQGTERRRRRDPSYAGPERRLLAT
jgi:hypothetical protein